MCLLFRGAEAHNFHLRSCSGRNHWVFAKRIIVHDDSNFGVKGESDDSLDMVVALVEQTGRDHLDL